MADLINTSNNILGIIPSKIVEGIEGLIAALWAIGVVFLLYLIWIITSFVLKWKDRQRLKRIEEKVDLLLSKKKQKLKSSKQNPKASK